MSKLGAMPRRLFLMQLATGTVPTADKPLVWPIVSYLMQMDDGTNVLVDSGLPADFAPAGLPPLDSRKDVIAQVAGIGLTPDDIDLLVCTHFDVDHAGHHDAFHRAELVVQRRQYDLARGGHPRYAAARAHWDHPSLQSRYRLIEGDTELLPGITLIETSGHAPGHQSVLVHLPQTGPVLLAIDAVPLERVFHEDRTAWPTDDNEEQLRASTRKLLDLVECEQVALTVFGHDGAQWQTLKKAPDYYE
jgi:N-acyl homoserine lactone hydrolase